MNKPAKLRSELLEIGIVVIMLVLVFLIITGLTGIQRTARVINYTGLVRGSTQRLVKLELMEQSDQGLSKRLDNWITELRTGVGDSDLTVITDKNYQERLETLAAYWPTLKADIETVRAGGEKFTLLEHSEEYFVLADELVGSAENYSNIQTGRLKVFEYMLLAICAFLAIELAIKTLQSWRMQKKINELNALAYADAATKLPNRTSCDEKVREHSEHGSCAHHGAIMFDLNNLKTTNDKYGHKVGDILISNFAHILGETAQGRCFVGRWGGDEFIAVFEEGEPEVLEKFVRDIDKKIDSFNKKSPLVKIDYAHGCCSAGDDIKYNMEQMIAVADENMYQNKAKMKGKA